MMNVSIARILPSIWYKPGKPITIPQKAFMPRPWVSAEKRGDHDGISVDRAALTTISAAATRPDNGNKAHLCEFGVKDVRRLRLTVEPKQLLNSPAHSVIPELNSIDRRNQVKELWMEEQAIALRDCTNLFMKRLATNKLICFLGYPMKEIACNYSAIRLLPSRETGEFVNVGVVVSCPEIGFFDFKLAPKCVRRVKGFFPELDQGVLISAVQTMDATLKSRRNNGELFADERAIDAAAKAAAMEEFRWLLAGANRCCISLIPGLY